MKTIFLVIIILFVGCKANAFSKRNDDTPSVLKADNIEGDQIQNIITATGNVEVTKGSSIIYADKMTYDKNSKIIQAAGDVKMLDIEVGKLNADHGWVKDDFTSGAFFEGKIIFNDGSYLSSNKIERKTEFVTVLSNPLYSICPNPSIISNNFLAGKLLDMISIKSKKTTIDNGSKSIKLNHAILRIYNVPVLYSPFVQFPMADNKRKTGFLHPSYIKNTRFGLGIISPFFIDIAPDKDLTVSPKIFLSSGQVTIDNSFRHLTNYGQYNLSLEISNNKVGTIADKNVINKTNKQYRWHLSGNSKLTFTDKDSLDYNLNYVGDRNYLREYNYSFLSHTVSDVSFDHTNGRQYYGSKLIKIQELIDYKNEDAAPLVMPIFSSYNETKPLFFKEKFALSTDATVIYRDSGLQYRRLSATPEVSVPFNLRGNLFSVNAKVQGDVYSLENNFQRNAVVDNSYNNFQSNYRPEISASWHLPLIQKKNANTLMIEPIINFVSSGVKKTYSSIPNEDSNNSELTANNLFINDRISGFDRNEIGNRSTYGVKSSMFNRFGQFGLTIGQSKRFKEVSQDVQIRGFKNNNKSNLIGKFSYKLPKLFESSYFFQLNESSYSNEVNNINATLFLNQISVGGNYILIRSSSNSQSSYRNNQSKTDQMSGNITFKITDRLSMLFGASHDFIIGRTISRRAKIDYNGCCAILSFGVSENNYANLTTPQRSFQINITLQNL